MGAGRHYYIPGARRHPPRAQHCDCRLCHLQLIIKNATRWPSQARLGVYKVATTHGKEHKGRGDLLTKIVRIGDPRRKVRGMGDPKKGVAPWEKGIGDPKRKEGLSQ